MHESQQQALDNSDRESRFKFHLISAHKACNEAKQDGSPLGFARCLSHAKLAIKLAKTANRPDLEQDARLSIVDFLEMADRKQEATEARIIAAAMVDNLKLEYDSPSSTDDLSGPRLAFVDGVPIDEVIRLLEDDGHEQGASYSGQKQIPTAAGPQRSDVSESQIPERRPTAVPSLEGRQIRIRDLQGRLATVLTEAPRLRHKAKFYH